MIKPVVSLAAASFLALAGTSVTKPAQAEPLWVAPAVAGAAIGGLALGAAATVASAPFAFAAGYPYGGAYAYAYAPAYAYTPSYAYVPRTYMGATFAGPTWGLTYGPDPFGSYTYANTTTFAAVDPEPDTVVVTRRSYRSSLRPSRAFAQVGTAHRRMMKVRAASEPRMMRTTVGSRPGY